MSLLVIIVIQTVVAFTLLSAFVFTAACICLSFFGVMKSANKNRKQLLCVLLIVEVVAMCIGLSTHLLNFSPTNIQVVAIEEAVRSHGVVYLHIPDATYKSKAEAMVEILRLNGFVVPGIVMVGVNRSPKQSLIRYFFSQQEDQAQLIRRMASNKKLGDFELQYVGGHADKVGLNTLEIWYGGAAGP